jgi:hypothetical protein
MNLNAKKHPMSVHDREAKLSGVGANAIWNGPFDTTALPKRQRIKFRQRWYCIQ